MGNAKSKKGGAAGAGGGGGGGADPKDKKNKKKRKEDEDEQQQQQARKRKGKGKKNKRNSLNVVAQAEVVEYGHEPGDGGGAAAAGQPGGAMGSLLQVTVHKKDQPGGKDGQQQQQQQQPQQPVGLDRALDQELADGELRLRMARERAEQRRNSRKAGGYGSGMDTDTSVYTDTDTESTTVYDEEPGSLPQSQASKRKKWRQYQHDGDVIHEDSAYESNAADEMEPGYDGNEDSVRSQPKVSFNVNANELYYYDGEAVTYYETDDSGYRVRSYQPAGLAKGASRTKAQKLASAEFKEQHASGVKSPTSASAAAARQAEAKAAAASASYKTQSEKQRMKTLDEMYILAKRTGQLDLRDRSLTQFPDKACTLMQRGAERAPEDKWWDLVPLHDLNLSGNNIPDIPAAIRSLNELVVFDVHSNEIAELPNEIGRLIKLKSFIAHHNEIINVPQSMGPGMAELVQLDLSHNKLAVLPDSFGSFRSLEYLKLDHNELTALPRSMGRLPLIAFSANSNRITSVPASIVQMKRLRTLDLQDNLIREVPPLQELDMLERIDLRHNQLVELPVLPRTRNLQEVFLDNNRIRSVWGIQLSPSIISLGLRDNALVEIPPQLAELPLQVLNLANNRLNDIPSELGAVHSLNKVMLEGNPLRVLGRDVLRMHVHDLKDFLRGRLAHQREQEQKRDEQQQQQQQQPIPSAQQPNRRPSRRASFSRSSSGLNLFDKDQQNQQQQQPRPSQIMQTKRLEQLIEAAASSGELLLSNMRLNEIVVPEVNAFSMKLKHIDLAANRLEQFPTQLLPHSQTLQRLNLSSNFMRELPPSFGRLSKLFELNLCRNFLVALPDELANLRELRQLDLSHNKFEQMPPAVLRLEKLERLQVSFNLLTVLPDMSTLPFLSHLDASSNNLEKIEEGLRFNTRLTVLNVSHNNLAEIPPEIGLMPSVKTLIVTHNPLRNLSQGVLNHGCDAIKERLRSTIPANSHLLAGQQGRPAPRPYATAHQEMPRFVNPNLNKPPPQPDQPVARPLQSSAEDAELARRPQSSGVRSAASHGRVQSFSNTNNTAAIEAKIADVEQQLAAISLTKTKQKQLKKELNMLRSQLGREQKRRASLSGINNNQ